MSAINLRAFRDAVYALAVEAGITDPSISVDLSSWVCRDRAATIRFGASIHHGTAMPAHVTSLQSTPEAASPDAVLASLRQQLCAAGYLLVGTVVEAHADPLASVEIGEVAP